MNKDHILAITGPSLVGKSTFLSELESILKGKGYSFRPITRVTTRPKRKGEIDGSEYKFYDNINEMKKEIEKGNVIANYTHNDHIYGILKSSLEEESDFKLVVIRDPAGFINFKNSIDSKIIPVLLCSDNEDVGQRIAQKIKGLKTD